MFEELGLRPFSMKELTAKILEKYQDDLQYVKEARPKFLEMERTDPQYADADLSIHDKQESLSPLYVAAKGFINPVRCDIIGGDDRPVGITKKAIKNALTYPQFRSTAEDIVRLLNTSSETWKESVAEVGKQFHLGEPFESQKNIGYPVTVYSYNGCIVAEGEDNREKFLESLQAEWKAAVNSKIDMLYFNLKASDRILGALNEFEELEYRKFMVDRIGKAIENRGVLEKPTPIYVSLALTMMESIPTGFRFRGFGNRAEAFLKHLEEQALDAGMSVERIEEKIIADILEKRKFFIIDYLKL